MPKFSRLKSLPGVDSTHELIITSDAPMRVFASAESNVVMCLYIGGDFNVDFTRHKSHSRILQDICELNNSS